MLVMFIEFLLYSLLLLKVGFEVWVVDPETVFH